MKTNKYFHLFFILLASYTIKAQGFEKPIRNNQYATIIGLVPESAGIDSVRLFLYPENTCSELSLNITGMTTFTSKVKDGRYSFYIPVNDKLLYFSLYKNAGIWPGTDDRLLSFHLVEKEDYVVINHFEPNLTFSGIGEAKHALHVLFSNEYGYDFIFDDPVMAEKSEAHNDLPSQYNFMCVDTFAKTKRLLQLLEKSKADLSEKAYQMLYCEIIGNCQYPLIRQTAILMSNHYKKIAQSDKDAIKLQFETSRKHLIGSRFSDRITASSIRYLRYYAELLKLERVLSHDTGGVIQHIIRSADKSELRDRLLISTIGFSYKRYGKSVQLAIDHMHSPALRNDLLNFYHKQKNGAMVPDLFLLSDQNNKEINLSSYKGKVIFLDFWYIGCAPCADYYKTTVSVAKKSFIDSKDVVFITVCTEKDYKKWITAVQSEVYTSRSSVNLFTRGVKDHPLIKYFNVVSAPTPLLIDKSFKIFSRDEILLGRGGNPSSLINAIKLCIKN